MFAHLEGNAAHLQRACMKDATSVIITLGSGSGKGLKSVKVQKCNWFQLAELCLTNLDSFASQATREKSNIQIMFNAL